MNNTGSAFYMIGSVPEWTEYIYIFMEHLDDHPWFFAAIASILVGLSGILPLLIIPIDESASFQDGAGAATLKTLLSFAVGGLLGDVFLHLLPESWEYDLANGAKGRSGFWCITGITVFVIMEKLFATSEHQMEEKESAEEVQNGPIRQMEIEELGKFLTSSTSKTDVPPGICAKNGTITFKQLYDTCVYNNNGKGVGECCSSVANLNSPCGKSNRWMGRCILREMREKVHKANKTKNEKKDVAGYLNLMANSIDNFTHGLAVGGAFLVGFRVGTLSTFAILVHEIPHEVGDFAILLKSGFTRWEAAKAQLATSSAGLIGAMTALLCSGASTSIEAKTSWIVPFTAGGFLHIALITVLPDLLKEENKWESLKHLASLLTGLAIMAFMTYYF